MKTESLPQTELLGEVEISPEHLDKLKLNDSLNQTKATVTVMCEVKGTKRVHKFQAAKVQFLLFFNLHQLPIIQLKCYLY